MNPNVLMALSASILGLLGLAHFFLTFWGPKLRPRDRSLQQAMSSSAPVITTQTDIWRMWVGFNTSHAMGAMLFGLVYGYLALVHGEVVLGSVFLQVVGFAMVAGFVVLAKLYWFITPLVGACVSLLLYSLSVVLAWAA